MVIFFQRDGWRSSRPLRAKFWDSLVTGTSASGPLANEPVTRFPRYRLNHVTGTLFRCPKSVPVTSIYCMCYVNQYSKTRMGLHVSGNKAFVMDIENSWNPRMLLSEKQTRQIDVVLHWQLPSSSISQHGKEQIWARHITTRSAMSYPHVKTLYQ